jgi:hypothetical protein
MPMFTIRNIQLKTAQAIHRNLIYKFASTYTVKKNKNKKTKNIPQIMPQTNKEKDDPNAPQLTRSSSHWQIHVSCCFVIPLLF